MSNNLYLRVPSTAPGLKLDSDKKGLTFRKELIYENAPGEQFVKKTDDKEQHFTVDADRLQHWEETGNEMIRNGLMVPTPIKHTDEPERNRGRIKRFEIGTNDNGRQALFGVVEFRDAEAAKLAASTDVSIFVPDKPVYDGFGNEYRQPIRHVCFTDYPVIPGLQGFEAIAASLECGLISDFINYERGRPDTIANMWRAHQHKKTAEVAAAPKIVGKKSIGHRFLHALSPLTAKETAHVVREVKKVVGQVKNAAPHAAKALPHFEFVKPSLLDTKHALRQLKSDATHNFIGSGKDILHSATTKVRQRADDAIKHVVHRAIGHAKEAVKETVREEIKGAGRSVASRFHPKNLGVGAMVGAAATGLLVHHLLTRKKSGKDLAASLELMQPPGKTVPHIVPTKKPPRGTKTFGEKGFGERSWQDLKRRARRQAARSASGPTKFARHAGVASAAIFGLAVAHQLFRHLTEDHDDLHASLELAYRDKTGRLRNEDGTMAKDPHSKASQHEKLKATKRSFASARSITEPESGLPTYKSSLQQALHSINNFHHADKNELGHGSNAAHAAKHLAVGALYSGIAGAGLIHSLKHGHGVYTAFINHGIGSKQINQHLKHLVVAGSAGLLAEEGMSAHVEAAAQHIRAALGNHKKK